MKRILLFLLLTVPISAYGVKTKYFITPKPHLTEVNGQSMPDIGKTINSYADSLISIMWSFRGDNIRFIMSNLTDERITIEWNNIAYINEYGVSERIIHEEVRFIDRSGPMPDTSVPPGAHYSDMIIPADNIYWQNGAQGVVWFPARWDVLRLFPLYYTDNISTRDSWTRDYLGKAVKIYFPVRVGDRECIYTFCFEIDEIECEQRNPDMTYHATKTQGFPPDTSKRAIRRARRAAD